MILDSFLFVIHTMYRAPVNVSGGTSRQCAAAASRRHAACMAQLQSWTAGARDVSSSTGRPAKQPHESESEAVQRYMKKRCHNMSFPHKQKYHSSGIVFQQNEETEQEPLNTPACYLSSIWSMALTPQCNSSLTTHPAASTSHRLGLSDKETH